MPTRLAPASHAPFYMINKPFLSHDRVLGRGEIISDISHWRNAQPLIDNRYMAPLHDLPETVTDTPDGRTWIDAEAAQRHIDAIAAADHAAQTQRRGPGRPKKESANV